MKKNRSFIRRLLTHSLFLANILSAIWLVLCILASRISPEELRHLALFSLTTPFAIIVNIAFLFFWIFSSRKWRSVLSLVVVVASYKIIPAIFGLHFFSLNDWDRSPDRLRIMTWNVHGMGIFNKKDEKEHAKGIVGYILMEDPDIVCLPEFSVKASTGSSIYREQILKRGDYSEYRFHMDNTLGTTIHLGTAIYSKYPLSGFKAHELDPYIFMLQCDVTLPENRIIRLYAMHLHSFGLSDNDKKYIEQVKKRDTDDLGRSRSFVWKFNEAYILRAREAEKAAVLIRQSPYPVIICGDFNDLPYSYTYKTIKGDLHDAFTDKGRGFGRSYNQIIPTLRIDHMFYDPAMLRVVAFRTASSSLSDHSPLIANFEIIGQPRR